MQNPPFSMKNPSFLRQTFPEVELLSDVHGWHHLSVCLVLAHGDENHLLDLFASDPGEFPPRSVKNGGKNESKVPKSAYKRVIGWSKWVKTVTKQWHLRVKKLDWWTAGSPVLLRKVDLQRFPAKNYSMIQIKKESLNWMEWSIVISTVEIFHW